MSVSLRDRYLAALAMAGLKPDARQTSRKYVSVTIGSEGKKLFLGKSGAVRRGATVTGSVPVSDSVKSALLEGTVPRGWLP